MGDARIQRMPVSERWLESLRELRAEQERRAADWRPPPGVTIEDVALGDVAADRIVIPDIEPRGMVLFLHGGAYVLGSRRSARPLAVSLARDARAIVFSVDYRLAPEYPFPAAVEDALSSYEQLLRRFEQPARMAVVGSSAGAGLGISLLVAARQKRIALPACAVAISPWSDLTCSAVSYRTKASVDPIISRPALSASARAYLAGADATTPLASPSFANLTGLPPLLIQVGTEECLLDDSIALDARARACGVTSTLEIAERMVHVWHNLQRELPEAREAITRIGEFCLRHWAA